MTEMTVSHRDEAALRAALEVWFRDRLPGAAITSLTRPSGNGLSSETLLVDVDAADGPQRLVARVAPDVDDVPVFPVYDLGMQFEVMRLVGERTEAPVPTVRWYEPDAEVVGAPFFVMDRVDGRVPADNPPYTFEGWLLDADPSDRRRLQDGAVEVLAQIHGLDVHAHDVSFLAYDESGPSALHRHVAHTRSYFDWFRTDDVPVVDEAFAWLERNWPADDGGPDVLSWGDSRIGNMLFDGFTPVGVLDWEMAGIGPRGIDLGWMVFIHTFFQDLTETLGLPGLAGFMEADDVAATYEAATGLAVDMEFWLVYAALRYAIVMLRVNQRMVAFGEADPPTDPEAPMLFADLFRSMLR